MKLEALLVALTSLTTIVVTIQEPVSFTYSYKVIANSNSINDIQQAYLYKEKLIETYENLVFDFAERDYQNILINNMDKFCFDNNCHTYYDGSIILIIGKGIGASLEGKLKQNVCDESVIHEKFYIFELFK